MFFRIRVAFGTALLITILTSVTAFAKGGFSFISITGGNLKEELRVTDPELTTDFFAFADFSQNKTKAPADPGNGYEITRYYIDGNRETAFDRLHYYPETGFVYYDGIANGESEYDGKWYTAKPEIKLVFEKALSSPIKPVAPAAQSQPLTSVDPAQTKKSIFQVQPVILVVATAGLAVILLLAFWLRRPATR